MSTYFTYFPIIRYDGVDVREVTRRTKFRGDLTSNPYVFLPYTVKDYEKPEDIAYHYYGTVDATWLVLLANNIVDPYTQWVLNPEQFNDYISEKYSEQSGKTGYEVVSWTQDTTSLENIVLYYTTTENGTELKVSPDTFPYIYDTQNQIIGRNVTEGWTPLRIYDYEVIVNENKREILVVDVKYYDKIRKEFQSIIKK